MNMFALPQNLVAMTLARTVTSDGSLRVNVENRFDNAVEVPETRSVSFDVPGFLIREFVILFQDLAGHQGREGSRGFYFQARSAVRLNAAEYVEHVVPFYVTFPQGGSGGVVQLNNMELTNPHLNYMAEAPPLGSSDEELRDYFNERVSDENLVLAFRRVHAGGDVARVSEAAQRRAARIANPILEPIEGGDLATTGGQPTSSDSSRRRVNRMISRRDPLPRYLRDLGLEDL